MGWEQPRKEGAGVPQCQLALHPCLRCEGAALTSSPASRNLPLGLMASSHRGNDLIGRTAAETEMPGDGFRNIEVIYMQMSSAVKKAGEENAEKSDVSAELFLYRIFFKDFNKATAAFGKGSRNKENTAASSLMKGGGCVYGY